MWRVSKSVVCAALLVPAAVFAAGPRIESSIEDVLLVRAGGELDPTSIALEGTPAVRWEQVKGKDVMYVIRPEWAQGLLGASRDKASLLAKGLAGRAFPGLGIEPASEVDLKVAVDLVEAGSSVEVVLRGSKGEVLKSLTASSPRPVRWQADLGRFFGNDLEESRVELKVLRGSARGLLSTLVDGKPGPGQPIVEKAGGSGYFNYAVNWQTTSALYYTVSGGPANTCGDLYTFRNGSWLVGGGWLCTNSSGYAYKGPWTWAGTPSDQTDKPAYIRWPDGTQTTPDDHVWDKTCATTYRTSPAYSNAVPLSYYGNATDAAWGAGFTSSWTLARSYFEDRTNPASILYWSPSTGSYNAARTGVAPSLSGMPGMTAYWNQTTFPPVSAHVSGHTYRWQTCVDDGHCTQCANTTFTAP